MKKIICLLIICLLGLTSCTKQPQTVVQVVDRAPAASESMPAVVEQKADNFSIPYPIIWGKMTDEPKIKGYRLPRPTFGYGVYEISPVKLLTISVIIALIIKGSWNFWHKDTVNVIGNVTATPTGSFQANANGVFQANAQGDFNAVPQGVFQANANGAFQANAQGDFNAIPQGDFNAVPQGAFQANANGAFQANANGDFNAVPQGAFQANANGTFQASLSNKKYNISPSSSSSNEAKKKKIKPKILIDESDKSSDVKSPDKSDLNPDPPAE
ncbi:MAG: hypothetical protein LE169_04320 [Endomicrobium sp.]|nr:hypothetical protein [Endomicrobium sp.]